MEDKARIGALYIRVSTDKQEELSPDAQKRLLLDYAKKNDILVDPQHIYQENGISGKRADRRPEFQKMIATAKQQPRPFDVILVWKFSRFARNQDESAFYKSVLRKKCGIDVVSITEPIAEGMYGRLIEMIIEWNDEFYSYNLSQEVIRGMDEKALRGGYQATPCLGYAAVGGGRPFVIVEDEYRIYQYICDRFDFYGDDATAIARKCNEHGWHTKRGSLFEARTINYILRNPFYIGIVNWNGHQFHGTHEIRADAARFEERQLKMDRMHRPHGRHNLSGCKHWLSGIVKCPICGASLGYNSNLKSKDPAFFQCWKYNKGMHKGSCCITEKKLIENIMNNFEEILNGKDFTFRYIRPKQHTDPTETELLKAELEKLENRERRIRLAYENEIDTLEEYRENKQRLNAERQRLTEELSRKEISEQHTITKEDFLKRIQSVYDIIRDPKVDYETKGTFMRSILEDIVYDKEHSSLIFHFYATEPA